MCYLKPYQWTLCSHFIKIHWSICTLNGSLTHAWFHNINNTTDLIRNVSKYWEALRLIMADTNSPNFQFKPWIFPLATWLEGNSSLESFYRKYLPKLNLNSHHLPVILLSINGIVGQKRLVKLTPQRMTQVLISQTTAALRYAAKVLSVFHFVSQKIKICTLGVEI